MPKCGDILRRLWLITGFVAALMIESLGVGFGHDALPSGSSGKGEPQGFEAGRTAPHYHPYAGSSPKARIEGGSRGRDTYDPHVIPLVPDHVGLTTNRQPVLYWYLSKPTTSPIIFVLIDTRSIEVIHDVTITPQPQPGVQRVQLKDFGISLEPNVPYRWYITVVLDADFPSRDIVSGGMVQRVNPEDLSYLPVTGNMAAVQFYAEAGLWYDAFASVSELIAAAPTNRVFRKQRASLLQQVGLQEVAEWDLRHTDTD
jgi:hypothetical protein